MAKLFFGVSMPIRNVGVKAAVKLTPEWACLLLFQALWDINRWGPDGIDMFKKNIHLLMSLFKKCLPEYTQVT